MRRRMPPRVFCPLISFPLNSALLLHAPRRLWFRTERTTRQGSAKRQQTYHADIACNFHGIPFRLRRAR